MKKIFLLLNLIFCYLYSNSQTLSASPTVVETGGVVTVTGVNETMTNYIFNANYDFFNSSSVSPGTNYMNYISVNNFVWIQTFNPYGLGINNPTPSKFSFKINSTASVPITLNVAFNCATMAGTVIRTVTITVNPTSAPTSIPNDLKSQFFTKNNCGVGMAGSSVNYVVPQGKYTGATLAEANSKAQNDINANGQNYANTNGQCLIIYYNAPQSGSFFKNDCANFGGSGAAVSYTLAGSTPSCNSTISQADADAKALSLLNIEGQNYANLTGQCASNFYILLSPPSANSGFNNNYVLGESINISFVFNGVVPSGIKYELQVENANGTTSYAPQTRNLFRFTPTESGQYTVIGRTISVTGEESPWFPITFVVE